MKVGMRKEKAKTFLDKTDLWRSLFIGTGSSGRLCFHARVVEGTMCIEVRLCGVGQRLAVCILGFYLAGVVTGSEAQAALTSLPGTILVTDQSNGTIRQYNASTGQLVGTVATRIADGSLADGAIGIAQVEGTIYCHAWRTGPVQSFGVLNPQTGQITTSLPLVSSASLGILFNTFVTVSNRSVFRYGLDGTYIASQNLDGNGVTTGSFMGFACDGTRYITTSDTYVNEVEYWTLDGLGAGIRHLNGVPESFYGLDVDPQSGNLWVIRSDTSTSWVSLYTPQSPNPVWSSSFNGFGRDVVYFPIPSAGTLCVIVGTLGTFARIRRRY